MTAVLVAPGLYVGGADSLAQVGALAVARLLSLGAPPAGHGASQPPLGEDACLLVHLEDSDDADLLSALPACCAFARRAESEGHTLLVACQAGVSRSVAVVVALLMGRDPGLDADTALDLLRVSHPGAHPNDGFVAQLRLFHSMGCRLDAANAQYRRHQLALLASALDVGTGAAAARLNADPASEPPAGGAPGRDGQGTVRCRRCSRLLALTEHTIPHEHGAGARSFGIQKQRKGDARGVGPGGGGWQCTSLFVEPIAWMGDALHDGAVSGKLACPKCAGRLGAFNWAGEQCGCGCWVTPAFQLHVSRVDVLPGAAAGVAPHTRAPRVELNKE